MRLLCSSSWLLILIVNVYCSDGVNMCPKKKELLPVPPADPLKVGTLLMYKCPLNYQGAYQWHHTFQDRVTTVNTPFLDSVQYQFQLTLEDFDNYTSAGCIVRGSQSSIPSGEGGIHVLGVSPRDYPVIYYNDREKINYECNEHIQFVHTKYIMLLKENDVKILNNTRDLTKANNGTMIACFYFKKIPSQNKVVREVTNKKILIYKKPENPTTTTLRTTSSTTSTTAVPSTSTIISIGVTFEQNAETTEYTLKGKEDKSAEVNNHNTETVIIVACVMSTLAFILVTATVSYILYQKCIIPNGIRPTVRMVTPVVRERPLPSPPALPANRYSYILPTHEYCHIVYEEP